MRWSLPLLLAAMAGALMPMQGAVNSWLAKKSSLAMATLWVYLTGAVAAALILLLAPSARTPLASLLKAPWPALLGGVMGVAITWLVASAVPTVGMVVATTGILVAQVTTAGALDHFGLMGLEHSAFTLSKAAGALLLVAGAWLLLRK